MAADTITPEQKTAAAKAAKAKQDAQRRANEKVVKAQLEKAKLPADTKLTAEQKTRAVESAEKKSGLMGKALETFIMEGKALGAQAAEAEQAQAAKAREERTRQNVTRSGDPEAAELAAAAKKLAPEVKSAFLPKDAREFIDVFTVTASGQTITVKRTGAQGVEGALEETQIKRAALREFAIKGEKDKDVRTALAGIGKGTRLWGRKLGLMILATDAQK